jgi:hypothetical protein
MPLAKQRAAKKPHQMVGFTHHLMTDNPASTMVDDPQLAWHAKGLHAPGLEVLAI